MLKYVILYTNKMLCFMSYTLKIGNENNLDDITVIIKKQCSFNVSLSEIDNRKNLEEWGAPYTFTAVSS